MAERLLSGAVLYAKDVERVAAFYSTVLGLQIADRDEEHQLRPAAEYPGSLYRRHPPPGWLLGSDVLALMAQRGIVLPRTAFTYLNLGPLRQKGIELSIDRYTMVNGSVGVKWANGRITTLAKVTNLLEQKIQQHVFGDVISRSVIGEVRFSLP